MRTNRSRGLASAALGLACIVAIACAGCGASRSPTPAAGTTTAASTATAQAPIASPASFTATASAGPATIVKPNMPYGSTSTRQVLDLYLPQGKSNAPVVVWIHGGGWQMGSKSPCTPVDQGFVELGYAVACINYRLTNEAIFPAQVEDSKAAIRWLRANAAAYSLDPERIGVWGASAGGHLAALLGTTADIKEFDTGGNLDRSSAVRAVCDFFGPTDLATMPSSSTATEELGIAMASKLLGGTDDAAMQRGVKASPLTHVTPDDAPFLIAHGDKDPLVPLTHSTKLHEALRKANVPSELVIVPGAGHATREFESQAVVGKVIDFFGKHLLTAR